MPDSSPLGCRFTTSKANGEKTIVYSTRQLALRDYVAMLSAVEKRLVERGVHGIGLTAMDAAGHRTPCASVAIELMGSTMQGISVWGFVTWARAGVVAATHTHGRQLQPCTVPSCDACLVTWRRTLESRHCGRCEKKIDVHAPVGPLRPAAIWSRTVKPNPTTGEPRLHIMEYENVSLNRM